MITDQQSNALSGATPQAASLYDAALGSLNRFCGDPIALLDEALMQCPDFAQAHLLKGFLLALATEPAATAMARDIVSSLTPLALNAREASQAAVLRQVLAGNWGAGASAMDAHNSAHPRDLAGLQIGHLMDFYRGSAQNLRDRPARALPHWSHDIPGYHAVLSMHAFGLEECADYGQAEETGRQALELEPLDAWAHHAVAHVMEMQGRAQDGIDWMQSRQVHWAREDNFFKIHNWWHGALCHLDLGQAEQALALYDGPIRGARSQVALDLVDASALLWRLHLMGCDVTDRWQELATCWDAHADGQLYPFNDLHAAMAYLGAGREDRLAQLIADLERNATGAVETAQWSSRIALPLIDGFCAFWRGNYPRCVETLQPVRAIANQFGGSHAQRDIIDWTLVEAALRADHPARAAFANERAVLKPNSPLIRTFLQRAVRPATSAAG